MSDHWRHCLPGSTNLGEPKHALQSPPLYGPRRSGHPWVSGCSGLAPADIEVCSRTTHSLTERQHASYKHPLELAATIVAPYSHCGEPLARGILSGPIHPRESAREHASSREILELEVREEPSCRRGEQRIHPLGWLASIRLKRESARREKTARHYG